MAGGVSWILQATRVQESLFSRGFVDLGSAPYWDADRCRAPMFSGVVAHDGRCSCQPQRVRNWDLPPVLPLVGSSATHNAWGGHIVAFRGLGRGRGQVVRRALAPVPRVMPGCRVPMRSKSKQHFGAVSYTERSIKIKRAVNDEFCTEAVYRNANSFEL